MGHRDKDWLAFERLAWEDERDDDNLGVGHKPEKTTEGLQSEQSRPESPLNVIDFNSRRVKKDTEVEKDAGVEETIEKIRDLFVCVDCRSGVFTKTTEKS